MAEEFLGTSQPVADGVLMHSQGHSGLHVASIRVRRFHGLPEPLGRRGVLGQWSQFVLDKAPCGLRRLEQQHVELHVRVVKHPTDHGADGAELRHFREFAVGLLQARNARRGARH